MTTQLDRIRHQSLWKGLAAVGVVSLASAAKAEEAARSKQPNALVRPGSDERVIIPADMKLWREKQDTALLSLAAPRSELQLSRVPLTR